MKNYNNNKIKIDFSLKREIFFVVVGAIIGAIVFVIPKTIFEVVMGMPYYLSWIVFGHVIGVYSSAAIIAGIGIHMVTAISIGVVIGIFLYKTGILNISKPSNGIIYGIFAGTAVFIIFFIPVYQFVLSPETVNTLQELTDDEKELIESELSSEFLTVLVSSLITHLIFGITVGLVSSLLSIKFGTRYRCPKCDISFGRIDSYQKHTELVHGTKPIDLKRILILGGGFAGIKILQQLQKEFQDNIDIDITVVSRDNFFLFTPMLPEVAASAIETRHILTPIRSFCKRARFYEANIDSINLKEKEAVIRYNIGKTHSYNSINDKIKVLQYDYLVLALGGETNFFDMESASKNAFTIKTIGDALLLRNHVINMLEQADMEYENTELQKSLMTFVVVGGGFSGVETVGELNDFVRDSVKEFYHNIDIENVKVILINSGPRVLPEVSEELSEFTLNKLQENGIQVVLNNRVKEVGLNYVLLNKGGEEEEKIPSHTVIWAGGVKPSKVIIGLNCEHDKSGKVITNENLKVNGYKNIFALGDCAFVMDHDTGKPYPPTAQHALREATIVSNNIINEIYSITKKKMKKKEEKELVFNYKTKGIMALIGKRNGVGIVFGHKIQGFIGWIFWRLYYLGNLPTTERKIRVMLDWFIDLFFKRDITRLKTLTEKAEEEK
ncbi:MAG: NAD(P)/FAD-dependent oxidoreductase [Nitrososphaeraceae archaeon]